MNRYHDAFTITWLGEDVMTAIDTDQLPAVALENADKIFSTYLLHEA